MDFDSRDAQVKMQEYGQRLQSQQKRLAVFDELSKIKAPSPTGEESIVAGLAKEISSKIMVKVEAMITGDCVSKTEFAKVSQMTEMKLDKMGRDVSGKLRPTKTRHA